ncbi:MAG: hypothetical protein ACT4O1_15220 [Gemmatimonadota bacterium]
MQTRDHEFGTVLRQNAPTPHWDFLLGVWRDVFYPITQEEGMTENPRIKALHALLDRNPGDARAHFGLAAEYEKLELWDAVVEELQQYLAMTEDEGNAWGRLGKALKHAGRDQEARAAYEKGVEVARAHGHPSMAAEFEGILAELE